MIWRTAGALAPQNSLSLLRYARSDTARRGSPAARMAASIAAASPEFIMISKCAS
jgi:hypothetical protein